MTARKEDLFVLLRKGDDVLVPRRQLVHDIDELVVTLRDMERRGEIVLGPHVAHGSADAILDEALRAFAGYHSSEVLVPRGADLVLADTRLLFYYQNRLAAHGLGVDYLKPS